jgi:O-antigen/teichoic acid export membrane protein
MSFLDAVKWSFIGEISTKIIQPLVFLVVVKYLTPRDYGIVTSALMVIGFCQIFWDAGLSKTLIQQKNNVEEGTIIHFWVNLFTGLIISIILYFTSRIISLKIFQDIAVMNVLKLMCLQIIISSFAAVYTTILQKEMDFKKLFWIRLMSVVVPAFFSIPLALSGYGYWALILGSLFGQFLQLIVLMNFCKFRPTFTFNKNIAIEMFGFSKWVLITALLSWFYIWADSMIVGLYLGATDMGLYRTGSMFSGMVFTMIFGPVVPVLYTYLSNSINDFKNPELMVLKLLKTVIVISVPISFLGFFYSNEIADFVFGNKWIGVGFVIGMMLIMHGFSWIVGLNGEIYRALGKPSYETFVTAGSLVVYLFFYIYSIKNGLKIFVITRVILSLGALIVHMALINKLLKFGQLKLYFYIFFISVCTWSSILFINVFFRFLGFEGVYKLFISGGLSFILSYLLIYYLDNSKMLNILTELLLKKNQNSV